MQFINISAIPNQAFSVNFDNQAYNITLKTLNNLTSATIIRNNVILLTNTRVVPGFPIIPYRYQESGNFVIVTANDEYAFYTQFGTTQFLIYASQLELDALRGT